MAEAIKVNIEKQEKIKQSKLLQEGKIGFPEPQPEVEDDDLPENYTKKRNEVYSKPPRIPDKQPVYGFQQKYQPIRQRMEAQSQKSKSFQQLFEYYKPLIEAKNHDENQDVLRRNIFNDEHFVTEHKKFEKDGKLNVNRLIKPFEMRLFDLRKQAYTI